MVFHLRLVVSFKTRKGKQGSKGLSKELIQGRLIWLEAYKNKMPKSSPNMHVKQEVSTRVKPRLLCKQSMGQNTPNDYDDGWLKFSQR